VAATGLPAIRDRLTAWLTHHAYPLWWEAGADRADGGFHDRLDLSGAPVPGPKRARVQARQAYCYARAAEFGWSGPWEAAMAHGLDFLERRHLGPDGLYRAFVGGGTDEARVDLYDQAFVLLALAAAARAGRAEAPAAARALLGRLPAHPLGGYRGLSGGPLLANPNMHLFEAALAWVEAGGGARWRALARGQATLALDHLIDPAGGALGEAFAAGWRAPPDPAERRIEPGHQFEWAWLLMRWSLMASDRPALAVALRLMEVAESTGIDPARRVAIDLLDGDLRPIDRGARLWPQSERLKAALLAGQITGEARWGAVAEEAAASLAAYLEVLVPGLWRDALEPDGVFADEPAKASSFYHLVAAIGALGELAR
jgi:mannose/cellobiose epimerase-like protein (N-acyl-D-glucosamine 2-epimerase family)